MDLKNVEGGGGGGSKYTTNTPVVMCYDKAVRGREYARVKLRVHASARKYNIVCKSSVNIVILYTDEIIEEIVQLNLELIKIKFNFWCVCVCK